MTTTKKEVTCERPPDRTQPYFRP